MVYKKSILILISGLLFFSIPSYSQKITFDEFIDQLIESHPIIEKENLTAQIESKDRNGLLGAKDWNLLSSLTYSHQEPALAIFGPERTDAIDFTAGIEKLFWSTGGRLSTSISFDRIDLKLDPLYGLPDSYYQNQFAITYIQPLLQNKGGYLDRLRYELKQFDIDFSQVQALENQENFLAESAAKFLEWVFLTEQNAIIKQRLKLSEEAFENIQRKNEANLVDRADVIRAEDAVKIAKQSLLLSESRWKGLRAELAVMTQIDNFSELVPEYDLYGVEFLPPLDTVITQFKENSRLVKAIDFRIKQLQYSKTGYDETTKPRLSLLAQFNIKNADSDFPDALAMDKPDIIGGLQFAFPLGNSTAKSMVAKTDLQIAQLQKAKEELVLNLTAAITSLYVQIDEIRKIFGINRDQIELSRLKTSEEHILYIRGRNDLTYVIRSQDDEQNARLNYAMNALTYQKLMINFKALTDALYK